MIEAILELESRIFKGLVRNRNLEIDEISKEYNVKHKELEPYFDLLENYRTVSLNLETTPQNRIIWNIEERLIIDYYVKNTNYSKTEKFKHLASILSTTKRTKEAISFDYYNNIAPKDKQKKIRVLIKNMNNQENEDSLFEIKTSDDLVDNKLSKNEKVDFLSNLNILINNAKNLSDFNLEEFFQGLTLLTSLALNKNNELKEIEELKLKVKELYSIIEGLNSKISILNKDIGMISNEIIEFKKLDSIDKIGKLEEFTDKLIELTNY